MIDQVGAAAIFHPTVEQVQKLLGRWIVAGMCHPEEAPFESCAYRVVGLVIGAPEVSLPGQILVDPCTGGVPSEFGFDAQLPLDVVRYIKLIPEPTFSSVKVM